MHADKAEPRGTSESIKQAVSQHFGQPRPLKSFSRSFHRVDNAPEENHFLLRIIKGVSCPGVAVSGLPDGPGIHKIQNVGLEFDGYFGCFLRDGRDYAQLALFRKEDALQMRVSEKPQRQFETVKHRHRFANTRQVFVFITRRAVPDVKVFQANGPYW